MVCGFFGSLRTITIPKSSTASRVLLAIPSLKGWLGVPLAIDERRPQFARYHSGRSLKVAFSASKGVNEIGTKSVFAASAIFFLSANVHADEGLYDAVDAGIPLVQEASNQP